MSQKIIKYALFLCFFSCPSALWAQLPVIEQLAGIKYIQGGVTKPESSAMQAQVTKWPLYVMMSSSERGSQSRSWALGVRIQVWDAEQDQVVFEHASLGPLLLVDLPIGQYVLRAYYEGQVQEKKFQLKKMETTRLHLHWTE